MAAVTPPTSDLSTDNVSLCPAYSEAAGIGGILYPASWYTVFCGEKMWRIQSEPPSSRCHKRNNQHMHLLATRAPVTLLTRSCQLWKTHRHWWPTSLFQMESISSKVEGLPADWSFGTSRLSRIITNFCLVPKCTHQTGQDDSKGCWRHYIWMSLNVKGKETDLIFKAVLGNLLSQKVNNRYTACHSHVHGGR